MLEAIGGNLYTTISPPLILIPTANIGHTILLLLSYHTYPEMFIQEQLPFHHSL